MKKFIVLAFFAMSSAAFADGAGSGVEDVIRAGGLTTVVGGCANAVSVGSGENSEIVYTEPCNVQQARSFRPVTSCIDPLVMKRFRTEAEASAHCGSIGSPYLHIGVTYDYGYRAFICSCYDNHQNGGQ